MHFEFDKKIIPINYNTQSLGCSIFAIKKTSMYCTIVFSFLSTPELRPLVLAFIQGRPSDTSPVVDLLYIYRSITLDSEQSKGSGATIIEIMCLT